MDVGPGYRALLRVLPGDANRDGRVNALDLGVTKQRLNRSVQNPGSGAGAYNLFADANGDSRINALDLVAVKANLNRVSPAPALAADTGNVFADGTPEDDLVFDALG